MQNQFFRLFYAKPGRVKEVCKLQTRVEESGEKNSLNWSGFWFQGKTRLCGLSQSLPRLLSKIHYLCAHTYRPFYLHLSLHIFWTPLGFSAVLFVLCFKSRCCWFTSGTYIRWMRERERHGRNYDTDVPMLLCQIIDTSEREFSVSTSAKVPLEAVVCCSPVPHLCQHRHSCHCIICNSFMAIAATNK